MKLWGIFFPSLCVLFLVGDFAFLVPSPSLGLFFFLLAIICLHSYMSLLFILAQAWMALHSRSVCFETVEEFLALSSRFLGILPRCFPL